MPTSRRKRSRWRISFITRSVTWISCGVRGIAVRKARHSRIGRRQTSKMFFPPTVTDRLSFFSRAPRQVGHSRRLMYRDRSIRTWSDVVSL